MTPQVHPAAYSGQIPALRGDWFAVVTDGRACSLERFSCDPATWLRGRGGRLRFLALLNFRDAPDVNAGEALAHLRRHLHAAAHVWTLADNQFAPVEAVAHVTASEFPTTDKLAAALHREHSTIQ